MYCVTIGDGKAVALIIPSHGTDPPALRSADELCRDHAARLKRDTFQCPRFFISTKTMGDVPKDLGDLRKLRLMEAGQFAGLHHGLSWGDELWDCGYFRLFGGVLDQ